MNRPPAFKAYAHELQSLVMGLGFPANSVAIHLLVLMWSQAPDQCSLPQDPIYLARLLGAPVKDWDLLQQELERAPQALFQFIDGKIKSPYLQARAREQRKYRKQQAEKGKLSAEQRAQQRLNRGSTAVQPLAKSSLPSSSSSSSSSSIKEKREGNLKSAPPFFNGAEEQQQRERFEQFYRAYPKHQGKEPAWAVWRAMNPDRALFEQIMHGVEEQSQSDDWKLWKGQKAFEPARFLREKRWTDKRPKRLAL